MAKVEKLFVEVTPGRVSVAIRYLKMASGVVILLASLLSYLVGIILTITIIGAIIGIPLMLATYLVDAIALVLILSPGVKFQRVKCPGCKKGHVVRNIEEGGFICPGCGASVGYVLIEGG